MNILITGANRGIGLELARQASASGNQVLATARNPAAATELASLDLRVEELDVANPDSVVRFRAAVGEMPVDLLVNNAGVGVGHVDFEAVDPERMLEFFRVNTVGALRVIQALLPNLRAGTGKRIVQITSRMGSIADNTSGGAYEYRASKAALNMITRSLALDLAGEGFVCVVAHPGWVTTDMGGPGAPLSLQESAAALLKVFGELEPSHNGSFINYDGSELPW